MKERKFYLIEEDVVPEIFIKVLQAKRYLATGKAKNASHAAELAELSRSAFYKYKDHIFSENESVSENIATLAFTLDDVTGVLSDILGVFAKSKISVLTINQNIPINGIATTEILNEKPKRETIQAVTVVPIFAPMMTPIA